MAGSKLHADVVFLGQSFEGALAATLLAKRGWKVVWAGAPASPTIAVGNDRVQAAPGLMPGLSQLPALTRALTELGLLADVQRLMRPVSIQLLDAKRRLTIPTELAKIDGAAAAFEALRAGVTDLKAIGEEPVIPGFFGRRAFAKRRETLFATAPSPSGLAGELVDDLQLLLGDGVDTGGALAIAAAPHDLPGGRLALVSLLHKRFSELGGTTVEKGLDVPAAELELEWSAVRCELGKGDELGGRVLLLGLDDADRARILPIETLRTMAKLEKKLEPDTKPTARLSFVVRSRGLPAALGPAAILKTETGLRVLLERRRLDASRDELALYWRRTEQPVSADEALLSSALAAALPFHERHVLARTPATLVPLHGVVEGPRTERPARRLLQARAGVLPVSGVDGASLAGDALAAVAMGLAPRKDLLR